MPVPAVAAAGMSLNDAGMENRTAGTRRRPGRGIPQRWGAATGGWSYFSAVFYLLEVTP